MIVYGICHILYVDNKSRDKQARKYCGPAVRDITIFFFLSYRAIIQTYRAIISQLIYHMIKRGLTHAFHPRVYSL